MGDIPPPYGAKTGERQGADAIPHRLVVRLQAWHFTPRGRCKHYNEELASHFSRILVQWDVSAADISEVNDEDARDHFVPVEVDFQSLHADQNDLHGQLGSAVRDLFTHIAPQLIHDFFAQIGSTPHAINMYPRECPDKWKREYTHACILNKMRVKTRSSVVPTVALEQQEGLFTSSQFRSWVPREDTQASWNRMCQPLDSCRRMLRRHRLDTLSEGKRWSNQALYQLIQDMYSTPVRLGNIEGEMKHIADQLLKKYKDDQRPRAIRRRGAIACTLGIMAMTATACWWNPAGWIALVVYGIETLTIVGGVAAGAIGQKGIKDIDAKRKAVGEAKKAIRDLRNSYNEARVVAAALFCHQVLKMPLDYLGEHEQEEILANLGVDVEAMGKCEEYRKEILIDRLRKLWHDQEKLCKIVHKMMQDNQLEWETREEAAAST